MTRTRRQPNPALICLTLSCIALPFACPRPALADGEEKTAGPAAQPLVTTVLDAISISATRMPESLVEIPGTVSLIEAEELERRNAQTPRDAIRYEPGVSIGSQPTRTGATNYTIRGIGGNRVRLQVDGVRVPDFPQSNLGAGTYSRDFVDIESLKRIEIVRGPASALYGSDALGGVVAYVTKDPDDYLSMVGKDWFASVKGAYSGSDNSFSETLTWAGRAGKLEALALYTRRDGEEADTNGGRKPNPQAFDANNFLGKLILQATDNDRLALVGEYQAKTLETNLLTDLAATVFDSRGEDRTRRTRLSLDWTHDAPLGFVDSSRLLAFYTAIDRTELTSQLRASGSATPNRMRYTTLGYEQDIWGGEATFSSGFSLFGAPNLLTYGITADYTATTRPRSRIEFNLITGTSTGTLSGETFPNKNFPDTGTTQAGAFVQDRMSFGALTVVPALRFDYYHLKPKPDAAFANSNTTGVAPTEETATAFSPKLGLTYAFTDILSGFGQYAHGFRAPPYDNVNFGFSNAVFGYQILPSANLKPETSDGFEAGLRGRFKDGSSFSVAGFYNRYDDFIDTVVVGTTSGGLTQFQYTNLSKVTIYGAEATGEWRVTPSWSIRGSAAYAHGEDEDTKLPIDSVDPFKLVGGLRYSDAGGRWGSELTLTHTWRHSRVSSAAFFRAPSYTVVDVTAHYEVLPDFTINVGVFNLTDTRYFLSQDVVGLASSSALKDLYAQPGRSIGANATYRW